MNDRYLVRSAAIQDVSFIAKNIREADRQEVWAASHMTPFQALKISFLISRDIVFTGLADGVPVCIFGVKPPSMLGTVAVPWLIGTDDIPLHSRTFLRESKKFVEGLKERFPVMENYVDARNVEAVRWLQWVGFSVYYPKPYGPDNLPFHRFVMEA